VNPSLRSSILLVFLLACDGDSASGVAAFRGEEPFLSDFEHDTGLVPSDSPAQVRIVATGSGGVVVNAQATAPSGTLQPMAGSGSIEISGSLALQIFAKIDTRGVSFDDMVHETSYSVPLTAQPFEPFVLDGTPIEARAELPPAEIARVPIPNIPGGTLVLNVTGGFVSAGFRGTCATALGSEAQYLGALTVSGEIATSATIEVEVPIVGTQAFGPFETTIPLPAVERDLDLGTIDLASGARSESTRSLCDALPDGGVVVGDASVPAGDDAGVGSPDAGGPSECPAGYDDCDGIASNGCETWLSSLDACGACGVRCDALPGTDVECTPGGCDYTCEADAASCDEDATNGCEVVHSSETDSCGAPHDFGSFDGDTSCGFSCPGNGAWDEFGRRTGSSSAWFKARVNEDSTCGGRLEHRISLDVPPGVDYDLFVYRGCGNLVAESRRGAGMTDTVTISEGDDLARSDSFDYWIEVRYFSGRSCATWELVVEGHDC
jgi:hypothetical protein